jgi:IPT/TIG domain-containing protein
VKRVAYRLAPTFFAALVVAGSMMASPLGVTRALAACSLGASGEPTVTGMSLHSGRNTGLDVIFITGCGFTDATFVYFGATPSQGPFVIQSDTTIQALTPVVAAGMVDVVVVNSHGTSAVTPADQFTFLPAYLVNCRSIAISPAVGKGVAGSQVELFASSTVCAAPRYEFWVRLLNGKWYLKQAYGQLPTFAWDTSGLPPGVYSVVVHVKEVDHTSLDGYGVAKVTLTGCNGALLSQPSNSSVLGNPVLFSANATGCSSPVYQFWIRDVRERWHLMQSGPSSNWTWQNAGWGSGAYRIVVWVNQSNSYMGRPQAYAYKDHLAS